jgi:hypothetical protein
MSNVCLELITRDEFVSGPLRLWTGDFGLSYTVQPLLR